MQVSVPLGGGRFWSLERIPEGLRPETSAPIAILDAKIFFNCQRTSDAHFARLVAPSPPGTTVEGRPESKEESSVLLALDPMGVCPRGTCTWLARNAGPACGAERDRTD